MNSTSFKNLKTTHKILIKTGALFLSIFLATYLIIIPALDKIIKLKKNIINAEISIKNNSDKKENINNLSNSLKTIEPQLDKLNQAYINKNKELEFITALEGIANKNNIKQTMDLKNFPDKNDDFSPISLEITSQGNFKDLMSYLSDLEASNYYININNLSLNRGGSRNTSSFTQGGETEESLINLNMSFKADTFLK